MWSRFGAATALLAGLVLLGAPLAAHAEDPVDLGGAYVLDTVGALSGDEPRVQAALDSLYGSASIQLFVVYVDRFSSPGDPVAWADLTADRNGLGMNDLLLAVAIDDRQYALSVAPDSPLSNSQIDSVERAIEDQLRNDQWANAAIAGAQALGGGGGGIPILPIVGGVAVVGAGVFIFSRIRKRGQDGKVTAVPDQMTQKQLDVRAGSLLVQLDDSLKTSEQELGFAVAQFGDEATKDFTIVLASAKAKVAEAFTVKQKLDDAQPDSDAEKREWTTRIIQLCEAADAELDSQADAFDDLRQLEKNAPAALAAVIADAAVTRSAAVTASTKLTELRNTYAQSALESVTGNPAQATKLLDFADAAAARAQSALDTGDTSTAAIAVRTAQSSVGQAQQLFAAIDSLAASLGDAASKLEAAVADTTQDIAAARALPAAGAEALAPAIAAAQAALSAAEAAQGDPLKSFAQVEQANAALDTVFTGVRDQQQQVARAKSQLEAAIAAARAQITSAAEFITTRRGAVGETARTRVSEADRHLQQALALATSDPVAALAEAQRASELGANAFQLAQQDVSGYSNLVSGGSSSGYAGRSGPDLGGLLGGLVGGLIGSSRSSGGWSGGSSRSGSSSRSNSGSRSGSFGGSSRSSARSSGGSRSRGGRF